MTGRTITLHDGFDRDAKVLTLEVLRHLNGRHLRDVATLLAQVDIGLSSAAMLRWAVLCHLDDEFHGSLPRDLGDLGRCERAHDLAPAWLQRRTAPLLEAFRAHLAARR
mgnify:CR=1 FL=1